MKKIVLDGTPFLFPGAGAGRVTRTLVENLAARIPDKYRLQRYGRCLRGKSILNELFGSYLFVKGGCE